MVTQLHQIYSFNKNGFLQNGNRSPTSNVVSVFLYEEIITTTTTTTTTPTTTTTTTTTTMTMTVTTMTTTMPQDTTATFASETSTLNQMTSLTWKTISSGNKIIGSSRDQNQNQNQNQTFSSVEPITDRGKLRIFTCRLQKCQRQLDNSACLGCSGGINRLLILCLVYKLTLRRMVGHRGVLGVQLFNFLFSQPLAYTYFGGHQKLTLKY